MNKYNEGLNILNEKFGNSKDNVISLATISTELSESGKSKPCVRDVDAYYENGVFYIVTFANTNKVKQIEANEEVSMAVHFEDFFASGKGKNLGWVLDPSNSEIRKKLRNAFKDWYDFANNEQDKNCCFVAIYLENGTLRINHGEKFYRFDFINKIAL